MMWPKLKSIQKPFLRIIKSVCKASETVSIFFNTASPRCLKQCTKHRQNLVQSPNWRCYWRQMVFIHKHGLVLGIFWNRLSYRWKENYWVPKPFHFCFYKQDSWQFHNCTVYHHELFIHLSSFFSPLLSISLPLCYIKRQAVPDSIQQPLSEFEFLQSAKAFQ